VKRTWLMRAGLGVALLIAVGVVLSGTLRPGGDEKKAAPPEPRAPGRRRRTAPTG
jgi:hypothetical protein